MLKYCLILIIPLFAFVTTYLRHIDHVNQYKEDDNLKTFKDLEQIDKAPLYYYLYQDPTNKSDQKREATIPLLAENNFTDLILSPLNKQLNINEKVTYALGTYSEAIDQIDPRLMSEAQLSAFLFKAQKAGLKTHLSINLNSLHSAVTSSKERLELKDFFRKNAKRCPRDVIYDPNCYFPYSIDFNDQFPSTLKYLYESLNAVWISKGFNGAFLLQGGGYHQESIKYFRRNLNKDHKESISLNMIFENRNANIFQQYVEKKLIDDLFLYNFPFFIKKLLDKEINQEELKVYLEQTFSLNNERLIIPATLLYMGIDNFLGNKPELIKKFWLFAISSGGKILTSNFNDLKKAKPYLEIYQKHYKRFRGYLKVIKTANENIFCFSKNQRKNEEAFISSLTCLNLAQNSQELTINNLKSIWKDGYTNILTNKTSPATDNIGTLLPHDVVILLGN